MHKFVTYILFLAALSSCGSSQEPTGGIAAASPLGHAELMALAGASGASNPWEGRLQEMPSEGCQRLRPARLGVPLPRLFNDSNYVQLQAADAMGVRPVASLALAWSAGGRLEPLRTCREYYVDELRHSLPYLVPGAHLLLRDIGRAFADSLRAHGGGDYRVKVTSLLRTPSLVRRLRRGNGNAVDSSAHLRGTTFDLSYTNFICNRAGGVNRTQEDLKNLLATVLEAQRQRGRCYVKYERKAGCFHITARPQP